MSVLLPSDRATVQEEFEESIDEWKLALMHDDDLKCARLGLGLTLRAIEKYDMAATILEEAVVEHDDEVSW